MIKEHSVLGNVHLQYWPISCNNLDHIENIKDFHHYTNSSIDTAAAAVNAGVNLEDGNLPVNVFSHLGDAILKVSQVSLVMIC